MVTVKKNFWTHYTACNRTPFYRHKADNWTQSRDDKIAFAEAFHSWHSWTHMIYPSIIHILSSNLNQPTASGIKRLLQMRHQNNISITDTFILEKISFNIFTEWNQHSIIYKRGKKRVKKKRKLSRKLAYNDRKIFGNFEEDAHSNIRHRTKLKRLNLICSQHSCQKKKIWTDLMNNHESETNKKTATSALLCMHKP